MFDEFYIFIYLFRLLSSFQEVEDNVDGNVFGTQDTIVNVNVSFFFNSKFVPYIIPLLCFILNLCLFFFCS